ncbi:HAD hydrolase-like protein [Pedobacter gandavensis]|uniref:HAD hydrolase-like protein n=1 Tax=Pedobacter gandavensis TaxID=2679963 RepID=UPI00292DF834|nr:HAD hydrolase-like protein [Pedobacter gandavensis]
MVKKLCWNSTSDECKNLLSKYGIATDLEEVIKRWEALTLERLKTKGMELMPDALEMIEFLHEPKLLLVIVTSSLREDNMEVHPLLTIADELFLD